MAPESPSTDLRVPARPEYSPLVATVVDDAAVRADLTMEQRERVSQAAKTGFEIIAQTAAPGAMHIVCRWTPADLCVSLVEHGMPIDDAVARRDPHWQDIIERVDRAHWKLRGRAGSELQLAVRRPHGITHAAAPPPDAESVALAPEQTYTIRRFTAADAPGVARAFYLTWGYHYIFPAVYVPQRLIALNTSNAYISMVAVAESGEIVGHYALDPVPGCSIADACAAIVVPAHRGRGLLERLRAAAEAEAVRLGFAAYYSEPVTTHGRTQSESAKFGARLCAIVLGGDPPSFVPKEMHVTGAGQRQSFTVYFKPLERRDPRVVYAPQRHRAVISKIYDSLALPVEIRDGAAPEGEGELHVEVVRGEGYATIDVVTPGMASGARLAQALSDLRDVTHIGAVYLNLPLEHPATPHLCDEAEKLGFFFCGVVPYSMAGHDVLRLQLPLTPIDLSGVTIVGDFGQALKAYIAAEMRT